MCISRYYNVINEEAHRHHLLYKSPPKEKAMLHCINITLREYVTWVKDWHKVAIAHPNVILEVRYEDIVSDVKHTMEKVLSFFDVPAEAALLEKMAATQMKKLVHLKQSIALGNTRRKGVVGEWRYEFTQEHKDYFKEIAGELLIELGYEHDANW